MIGVAVVILLLLGIGGYAMMGKKPSVTSTTTPTTEEASPTPTPAKQSGSLRQLLSGGVAQKCTYSSGGTEGTVYVGGGKMRGDMQTTSDDKTIASHVIVDGKTSYIWMDGQTSGYKMSWAEITPAPTGAATQSGFNPDQDVNYDCGAWVADSSQFTLPTEITFTEFGKMTLPTGSASQCDACNQLTGTAKTQCQTALGCN